MGEMGGTGGRGGEAGITSPRPHDERDEAGVRMVVAAAVAEGLLCTTLGALGVGRGELTCQSLLTEMAGIGEMVVCLALRGHHSSTSNSSKDQDQRAVGSTVSCDQDPLPLRQKGGYRTVHLSVQVVLVQVCL